MSSCPYRRNSSAGMSPRVWSLVIFSRRFSQSVFEHSSAVNNGADCHRVAFNSIDNTVAVYEALAKIRILKLRHDAACERKSTKCSARLDDFRNDRRGIRG